MHVTPSTRGAVNPNFWWVSRIVMKMRTSALIPLYILAVATGCSNSNPSSHQAAAATSSETDRDTGGGGSDDGAAPHLPPMCVQVFYDGEKDSSGKATLTTGDGRLYADMIVNLLGHFQEIRSSEKPVALYQKGDFDHCAANLYVGSDYYASFSNDFLSDFATTPSRVAWMGYGFWNLDLASIFGAKFIGLMEQDAPATSGTDSASDSGSDSGSGPGFYRDVLYKGEVFPKYGKSSGTGSSQTFDCDCEVSKLQITDPTKSTVLAQIRHSVNKDKLPYALQAGPKFLFADLPLTYIYEADRYNVFADVLFDIVNLPARHTQHLAALRLEDIHAFVDLSTLDEAIAIFKNEGVIPNLSIIPLFADPLAKFSTKATSAPIPASSQATFMQHIDQYKTQGAVFLWHGVTHQYESTPNPYDAVSGDDYEFWDDVNFRPWPEDSESFVTNRLSQGHDVLMQMGLSPRIWVTPHYVASELDNGVFARVFQWSMGRLTYFTQSAAGGSSDGQIAETQFFPYEIYKDTLGTHVIPENLNYVTSAQPNPNPVTTILANAKRNLVLRDSWASGFYHPYLLKGQDPTATDLQSLISGLKSLGYTFVNLQSCLDTSGCLKN